MRRGPGPIANDCTCPDGDVGWHYPQCIGGHYTPTTASNDPPSTDTEPIPKAEPGPLTDIGDAQTAGP